MVGSTEEAVAMGAAAQSVPLKHRGFGPTAVDLQLLGRAYL
jgi:hypothetical protein